MLCYMDKTFCKAYNECKHGLKCNSALTPIIFEMAERANMDISACEKRECFEEKGCNQ